jgi:hypothetical protein
MKFIGKKLQPSSCHEIEVGFFFLVFVAIPKNNGGSFELKPKEPQTLETISRDSN